MTGLPPLRTAYAEFVEPPPPPAHVELCAQWLLQFLTAAEAAGLTAAVVRAAAQEGFPRRTLYRARQALADLVVDLGNSPRDPGKLWTLAAEPSPPLPKKAPPPKEGPHRDSGTVAQ